mgnify:CR=1 FL=1
MNMNNNINNQEIINSAKSALTDLINSANPKGKWNEVLTELKPQVTEALNAGVSRRKIHQTLKESGVNIPTPLFHSFFGLRKKRRTKNQELTLNQPSTI